MDEVQDPDVLLCIKMPNSFMMKCIDELRRNGELFDISIKCKGSTLEAHKLVLSAGSSFFKDLLKEIPDTKSVLLKDIDTEIMDNILDLIYCGVVYIHNERLNIFIDTAASLGVRGFTQKDTENYDDKGFTEKDTDNYEVTDKEQSTTEVNEKSIGNNIHLDEGSKENSNEMRNNKRNNTNIEWDDSFPAEKKLGKESSLFYQAMDTGSTINYSTKPPECSNNFTFQNNINTFSGGHWQTNSNQNSFCDESNCSPASPSSLHMDLETNGGYNSCNSSDSDGQVQESDLLEIGKIHESNTETEERSKSKCDGEGGGGTPKVAPVGEWRCMQPQTCNICLRKFSNAGNLRQHITNVHTPAQFVPCNICHRVFKNKEYLRKHIVQIHKAPLRKTNNGSRKASNDSEVLRQIS